MPADTTADSIAACLPDEPGPELEGETSSPPLERAYLVGFMAAGKSAIGSVLAPLLGFRFLDLDRMIEDTAGARVHKLFERHGEEWFRDLEHECLKRTEDLEHAVIATGGGTMTFDRNREVIRRLGTSIWIAPPLEVLFERLDRGGRAKRPLYNGHEQARDLYNRRRDAYRMADLRIKPSSTDTARDVAARIAALIRARNCVI